jgi:type I restriction enzyme R subunit
MQDRLDKGSERLDNAFETIALLCEPVQPPKGELEHIHYFCGNTEIPEDLAAHEAQRVALYKAAAALVRAYANIADDLPRAGYSEAQIGTIKRDLERHLKLREIIRKASGETIDLKAYEADMRHLIDTYIEAKDPRQISDFGEMGLLDLIVKSGMADAIDSLPDGIKGNKGAVAETIANNVRSKIIKDHLNDPAFYDKMSTLLTEILADLRAKRIDYEEFLKRVASLAAQVQKGAADNTPEPLKKSPGLRAIFNQLEREAPTSSAADAAVGDPPGSYGGVVLGSALDVAMRIDAAVRSQRPDGWRGVRAKELVVKSLIHGIVSDTAKVERLFLIVKAQTEY